MTDKSTLDIKLFQFTPPVLIALITAIVGPLTLFHFEDVNQKRELQEQLLSKVLDHATASENENGYLDRLAIVIALVEDNEDEFGLTFPSAEEIVSKRQQLTVQRLESQLAKQTSKAESTRQELANATSLVTLKNSELQDKNKRIEEIEKRIEFLNLNRDLNKKEINELAAEKDDLSTLIANKQSEIDKLESDKNRLEKEVNNANAALQKSRKDIEFLTARDKSSQDYIHSLEVAKAELERRLNKSEQYVSNLEATVRDFKTEIQNKADVENNLSKSKQQVSNLETKIQGLEERLEKEIQKSSTMVIQLKDIEKNNTNKPKLDSEKKSEVKPSNAKNANEGVMTNETNNPNNANQH
jgi:chromosome segregation protein